jgi:hypothetical protein
VDVIEEGKALHSSYGQDGYCEEVFLTTVQNFAHSVKKISNNLDEMAKEAIVGHEEKAQQNLHNADAESVNIERDPGIRKGMKLTEKERQYLISKGPYQPCLERYPTSARISKKNRVHSVQNGMKNIHFWNTAQKPIGHSALRVACLEMEQDLRRLVGGTGRPKE